MTSVHFSRVSFSYSTATPVIRDVDLDLGPGWYGVVGANGAGKTSLLRLVAGSLDPTAGSVRRVGVTTCASVPQETIARPPGLRAFAVRWDGHAARLRSRLHLDLGDLDRWPTLSPGERTRWAIATALGAEPELLLLDEPTNHLDSAGRDVLVEALSRFDGIALVVSHDRALLDDLTTRTLRVHDARVGSHAGSYTEARRAWEQEERERREAYDRSRREERRLAAEAARLTHARTGAERGSGEARRRSGAKEHDAHSTARKFRAARAAAVHARRSGVAGRRLERQRAETAELEVSRTRGGGVELRGSPSHRDTLMALRTDVVAAPDGSPLIVDVDLHVGPHDRIRLHGPNGGGKTTLLRALLECHPIGDEEVVVIPQELDANAVAGLWGRLTRLEPDRRGRVLGIAANLGADPGRLLETDRPSPGEARKLALSFALDSQVPLVVLDEPTNHLDLPAIERLETALEGYAGAILLVTHDDDLARRVTTTTWEIEDGRVLVRRDRQSPADSSASNTPMTLPSGSRK